jgi:hypothetical protein
VKAASPALLRVIAMGAFLIYCTVSIKKNCDIFIYFSNTNNFLMDLSQTIVMYPNPSLYTCVAKIWLREIGFSLTYGALMLKTWRYDESVCKNVKNKITNIHIWFAFNYYFANITGRCFETKHTLCLFFLLEKIGN